MTQHDDSVSLRQMLEHGREALGLVQHRAREDLDKDRVLTLALCRLVEIIGEAAHRVSESCRGRYTDIPWRQIVGLRNRLIHGYDSIDLDVLWEVLTGDLPPLVHALALAAEAGDAAPP